MVKNPPSSVGDTGSIPGRGIKIPHATGQLSPRATTREKIPSVAPKTQHSQKSINKINIFFKKAFFQFSYPMKARVKVDRELI